VVIGWLTVLFFVAPSLLSGLEQPLQTLGPDLAAALRVFGGKAVDLTGGLVLLWYLILRPYRFWETFNIRLKGLSWGIGGYLAAYPAVLAMAALTEQLVAGGGGGNPVLSAIAESTNPLAQGLFLVTVVGLAPIFEEILFRGLLFPSLTTVMTVPQGIFLSGIIFGAIHTSAAEFLPLSVLGMILAYSYQQTRNLAVPILIHMLFNGVTFGALLVLGGA
jgi:membrane protease YdiL (CAAX protease family)